MSKNTKKKAPVKAPKPVVVDIEETEDTGEEVVAGGNVVPERYRKRYGSAGNNGDEYALAFADLKTREELTECAIANGIDKDRWQERNNGMYRMNLGNVLRGLRSKQVVTINGVEFPVVPKPAKKAKPAKK